jgi:hypothetical protein
LSLRIAWPQSFQYTAEAFLAGVIGQGADRRHPGVTGAEQTLLFNYSSHLKLILNAIVAAICKVNNQC